MRASLPCRFIHSPAWRHSGTVPPLIQIQNGTFYRRHPSPAQSQTERDSNRPLFANLDFILHAHDANQHVAVVGPSNAGKTTFLQLLQGQHLSIPPTARKYPYLSSPDILARDQRLSHPPYAIQYVGFDEKQKGLSGMGSYLSARFESRKEQSDFKLLDYLQGRTQLNTSEELLEKIDEQRLSQTIADLRLENLLHMPVINLSNGQTRRARIAKALLGRPELLLLDEPFMGLDPPTTVEINPLLRKLAYSASPRILLALRPQDPIPSWITDIIYLGEPLKITARGDRCAVTKALYSSFVESEEVVEEQHAKAVDPVSVDTCPRIELEFGRILLDDGITTNPYRLHRNRVTILNALVRYEAGDRSQKTKDRLFDRQRYDRYDPARKRIPLPPPRPPVGEALLELNGVTIKYGTKTALGDWQEQLEMKTLPSGQKCLVKNADSDERAGLNLTVKRGQRWAIVGPNGSGKTTLLSLITSDHPQAYSAPMKLFGRSRLATPGTPGLSLFEIQSRIGQSSPEVHSFFPKHLSVRRTLESAWADTFLGKPRLTAEADRRVDACLRWFQEDLNPAAGPNADLHQEITSLRFGSDRSDPIKFPAGAISRNAAWQRSKQQYQFEYLQRLREAAEWADDMRFGEMPFSGQRVALFLRAVIAKPDIVILDEALSGMDDHMRNKCLAFLEHGESRIYTAFQKSTERLGARDDLLTERGLGCVPADREWKLAFPTGLSDEQALVIVSHIPYEIPSCVGDWIFLPETGSGQPAVQGQVERVTLREDTQTWQAIWASKTLPKMSRSEYEQQLQDKSTVGPLLTPAGPDADALAMLVELNRLASRRYVTVGRHIQGAHIQLRGLERRLYGIRHSSTMSEQMQRLEEDAERLSGPARLLWEQRTQLLFRKDVSQLSAFVQEVKRLTCKITLNWTNTMKSELNEIIKSHGYRGFKKRQIIGFRLPDSVEDIEHEVRRHWLIYLNHRTNIKYCLRALYGSHAANKLMQRTGRNPVYSIQSHHKDDFDEIDWAKPVTRLRIMKVWAYAVRTSYEKVVRSWAKISNTALPPEQDLRHTRRMQMHLRSIFPGNYIEDEKTGPKRPKKASSTGKRGE